MPHSARRVDWRDVMSELVVQSVQNIMLHHMLLAPPAERGACGKRDDEKQGD